MSVTPVSNDNTARRTTEGVAQLELACLEKAGRRFMQAKDTLFLTEPLALLFREKGTESVAFQEVLNGTFICPPETNQYAMRLLSSLKRHPGAHVTPWTLQEQTSRWKKVRETTASSMSSVHFGHYMAGTFNPDIALLNAMMADILLLSGYSPRQWRKGLNIMLQTSKTSQKSQCGKTTDHSVI